MRSMKPALTVYYDGACPVCSAEIAAYQRQTGADACEWVDATRCEPSQFGPSLDREQALTRMTVRLPDGSLRSGAAAFAAMWLALPRTRLLGRLASTRPMLHLLDGAYSLFLKLRPLWRKRSAP